MGSRRRRNPVVDASPPAGICERDDVSGSCAQIPTSRVRPLSGRRLALPAPASLAKFALSGPLLLSVRPNPRPNGVIAAVVAAPHLQKRAKRLGFLAP